MASVLELLEALADRLKNDAALTAVVPASSIKNHVPQNRPLPYIAFRVLSAADWSCRDQQGYLCTIQVDFWAEDTQRGDCEPLRVAELINSALQWQELTPDNVFLNHITTETGLEPDGITHRAALTYEAALL